MILGITAGWSGISEPFHQAGREWWWFKEFLLSWLALIVLAAIYLSLALGAFAIAVSNIRRRAL